MVAGYFHAASLAARMSARRPFRNSDKRTQGLRILGRRLKYRIMSNFIRRLVSQNKTRHVADGYDLDLTYVTPRIIALGLPASGIEKLYRNPISEVRSFLSRHAGHYAMVNLCDERETPRRR